jgi:hypothetical protein
MEKLLYKRKWVMKKGRSEWVFRGMKFSKNINGWSMNKPPIEWTLLSNICNIPDRLLPSRACFHLYRLCKGNTIKLSIENNTKENRVAKQKNTIFVNSKQDLKMCVNLFQYLILTCKLFLGRHIFALK